MQNLSMFDDWEQSVDSIDTRATGPHIDVVKMDFVEAESMTWQELFDGFDTLNAITYSSGIGFIYQLLDKFDDAEIIFGCDDVISYSLQEIMAYQSKTIESLKSTAGKDVFVSGILQFTDKFFGAFFINAEQLSKFQCSAMKVCIAVHHNGGSFGIQRESRVVKNVDGDDG